MQARWALQGMTMAPACARPDGAQPGDASIQSRRLVPSDDDGTVGMSERLGLRLLEAVAADMGLKFKTGGKRQAIFLPDTANAAGRVLGLLRRGELGHICFDAHPPVIGVG